MDSWPLVAAVGLVIAGLGITIGYLLQVWFTRRQHKLLTLSLDAELKALEDKQRELIVEARREANKLRDEVEREIKDRRDEVLATERSLRKREQGLDRRAESQDNREDQLRDRESSLDERLQQLEKAHQDQINQLERIAGMTRSEAVDRLVAQTRQESREQLSQIVRDSEREAKEQADHKARWLIGLALQRVASEHTSVSTVSVVALPSDEMKGRLIGREGRNIRALESATGVDLIVDDTPETVVLSCFDPVRREIARNALTRLIEDGRIHPTRIEEQVGKARREIQAIIKAEGERASYDVGFPNLHADLINMLGRLRYRQSFGQNVLSHSLEVAFLAGTMASEAGGDPQTARFGGLLHDIGKAIDHEVEGPHALIGAERCRRFDVPEAVAHAVEAHHFEVEPHSFEAFVVAAADAISASRPGARRETVELFVRRLEELETIANSFDGIEKSYAVQAGRELRIAVKPEEIDELGALRLSRDVAAQIKDTMTYPGQIKVTVIRETRSVDYAK